MSASADDVTLSSDLYRLPFQAGSIGNHVASLFAELVADYGIENVLVLKRFPTGIDTIADGFAEAIDGVERPRISGLSAHANNVLTELPDLPQILDQSERNLLLATYVRQHDWSHPYLQRASDQDSFPSDVARFVTEATWQGGDIQTEDEILAELADANDAFHEWLANANLLDPARSLQYAATALVDPERRSPVQSEFDVVLALDFEEFTGIDREYLARFTTDIPLICVAETDSAIQRTWNEPRTIEEHLPHLDRAVTLGPESDSTPQNSPATVASYLATGACPDDSGT